jgi:hypothetical protein
MVFNEEYLEESVKKEELRNCYSPQPLYSTYIGELVIQG